MTKTENAPVPDPGPQPTTYSPLSGLPPPAGGIDLVARDWVGKLDLRGDPRDPAFTASVKASLGIDLPLEPNTTCVDDGYTTFWLGPDEWLIHTAADQQGAAADALQTALAGQHFALTDVSDYYLVLRMSGARAREVLSKGTPFDVHPNVFAVGACAQTCFGHAAILLHCVDDTPTFDIQVRWSFAEYLWSYFLDGAKEYA